MKRPPLVVVMGVSACGKSTVGKILAKKLELEFLDGDDFHSSKNIEKMASGTPLNDEDRQEWLEDISWKLSEKSKENKGLVIACSALKVNYRNIIRRPMFDGDQKQVIFLYIKGTMDLFKNRIAHREGHFMPVSLLQSQFDALEEPYDGETKSFNCNSGKIVEVDAELSPAEIVEETVKLLEQNGKSA